MGEIHFWEPHELNSDLSRDEMALRIQFVKEYVKDFNAYQACVRLGLLPEFAKAWSKKFMDEPYVQRKISEHCQYGTMADDKAQKTIDENMTLNTIRDLMCNGGDAARAAAAKMMMSIRGMDSAAKADVTINGRGGVMVVPTISSVDDWEKVAQEQQERLMNAG